MVIGTSKQIKMGKKAHFQIIKNFSNILNLYFEAKVVECIADLNKYSTFYLIHYILFMIEILFKLDVILLMCFNLTWKKYFNFFNHILIKVDPNIILKIYIFF